MVGEPKPVSDIIFVLCDLVAGSLVGVVLAAWCGLSTVIGYLAAGLMLGPHGLNVISMSEGLSDLGTLGVGLLMFIVGLELSFSKTIMAPRAVFKLGGLQFSLTTISIALFLTLAGFEDWFLAIVVGGALAMSSTAIAGKHLAEQDELSSQHGRLAIGVLLFQDLATLPLLLFAETFAQIGSKPDSGDSRAILAAAFFVGIVIFARRTLAWVLTRLAEMQSKEIFLLAALAIVIVSAAIADEVGLSVPVGAFLVGMVLGESDLRHHIQQELRPFRDVLLGLFFITVGMSLDVRVFIANPVTVCLLTASLIATKAIIAFGVAKAVGHTATVALRAAIILSQSGEFSLLILSQAAAAGVGSSENVQLAVLSAALSMSVGSILIQHNGRLAVWLQNGIGR